MFAATYGPLFWAEQHVSSSITSILEATLPITTLVLEVFILRTQPLRWPQICGAVLTAAEASAGDPMRKLIEG